MLPLMLDLSRLRLVLVGNGEAAVRRLRLLEEAGGTEVEVYAETPLPALVDAAGARLRRRWPDAAEFARANLVFIADPPSGIRVELAAAARAGGGITHVEDTPSLTDCHVPSVLRRGDLVLAVSTGGGSPALAARIKRFLGGIFGPEWAERLDQLAQARRGWRNAGADAPTLSQQTEDWVNRHGWLPEPDGSSSTAPADVPAVPALPRRRRNPVASNPWRKRCL